MPARASLFNTKGDQGDETSSVNPSIYLKTYFVLIGFGVCLYVSSALSLSLFLSLSLPFSSRECVIILVFDFGTGPKNTLLFNPQSNILMIGGFGNLREAF